MKTNTFHVCTIIILQFFLVAPSEIAISIALNCIGSLTQANHLFIFVTSEGIGMQANVPLGESLANGQFYRQILCPAP